MCSSSSAHRSRRFLYATRGRRERVCWTSSACIWALAGAFALAFDQGAQALDAADVQGGMCRGDEQPLGDGHIELGGGGHAVPVLVGERPDVGVARGADVAHPLVDAPQRVDRVADVLGGARRRT
jgi:hypothetical protein